MNVRACRVLVASSALLMLASACSSSSGSKAGLGDAQDPLPHTGDDAGTKTAAPGVTPSEDGASPTQPGTSLDSGVYMIDGGVCGHGKAAAEAIKTTCASGDGIMKGATAINNDGNYQPALGDVDGDGNIDIVLGGAEGAGIEVLFGKGDGTFGAPVPVSSGNDIQDVWSGPVVTGDFNGDGLLDLATVGQDGTLAIWINNGGRTFGSPPNMAATSAVNGIAAVKLIAVDLNGDGQADIVAISGGSDPPQVLLSNCGTFGGPAPVNLPASANGAADALLVDVNGDGKLDLITQSPSSSASSTVTSIMFGNGDGTFAASSQSIPGDGVWLAIGDINGDGQLDIVTYSPNGGPSNAGDIGVLLGTGGGKFGQETTTFPLTGIGGGDGTSPSFVLADVNNDGHLDVVAVTEVIGGSAVLAVMQGDGHGTFAAPNEHATTLGVGGLGYAEWLLSADFNKDGLPDFLMTTFSAPSHSVTLSGCN